MHDSSPAVRDAAIELVGKYVVSRPDLASKYLPQICERITASRLSCCTPSLALTHVPPQDTGLSVRRRVVKLLRALFSVVEQEAERVEICRKLVWRVSDDDDGIKVRLPVPTITRWTTALILSRPQELAVDTVEELWFSRTLPSTSRTIINGESQAEETTDKSGLAQLASIIMAVAGETRDRPPPVDEVLRMVSGLPGVLRRPC